MFDTMEEFYKAKYTEANDERFKYLSLASQMTGYFSALARYNSSIPKSERIKMFNRLIEMWEKLDADSRITQDWIAEWKKEIQDLSA